MSWLVYIIVLGIIQVFLGQMYSLKYYSLEKYVLYLLSLFLIICDRAWEKGPCRAFKKNRVITTVGKSRL